MRNFWTRLPKGEGSLVSFVRHMKQIVNLLVDDLAHWRRGWFLWIQRHLTRFGFRFETNKSIIVDILMAKRGGYQRPFLHFSLGILFVAGVLSAPILASAQNGNVSNFTPPSAVVSSIDITEYGVQTQVSEKPRDQVINYGVVKGDTLSTIAEKFGVSVDTIKWSNDISRDSLTIGQNIKIPPVTGVVHKVRDGETVYSIAKKYKTDAQKIVNFPFNDFADLDSFALNVGQTLVVPDGVVEAAPAIVIPAPSVFAGGTGQFMWPTNGVITQYPIWYHMALDIANPSMPAISASDDGVVVLVQYLKYDYGQHVIIDHGNGYQTLYGHMSEIYVTPGQKVSRGTVIGRMGSTGRSTGTHLHFEIRRNGVTQNPLSFLK
jgi:murein DD-endopeptidase MepM/ murein hydrolase activator NlpD